MADSRQCEVRPVTTVAIVPDDFVGLVPKWRYAKAMKCSPGSRFPCQSCEVLKVVSPAQGKVKAVVRGERRKILRVEVEVTGEQPVKHPVDGVLTDGVKAKALLLESGLWAMTLQRPYAIVTNPDVEIRDIFVSGFDSAPLAESPAEFTDQQRKAMQAGVKLLATLTAGKVYVTRQTWQQIPDLEGAEMVTVSGPHPSGNAGTAIGLVNPSTRVRP